MKIAALVLLAVIVAGLLWGVGEMHYRNCLTAADMRGIEAGTIDAVLDDRQPKEELVEECSRLPF